MNPTLWHGCYEANWKGVITPESFAHPAKYSRSLIERIFKHYLAQGYVSRGDLVGDCFGGIGTGGVTAAYAGLRWVGCELEPRFAEMAKANFALHADKFVTMGLPQPTIIRGDSRKFDEVVGAVAGVITSPPFRDARSDTTKSHPTRHGGPALERHHTTQAGAGYGSSEGQIDELQTGTVQAVICSPPYSDIAAGAGGLNTKPAIKPGQQSGRSAASASQIADQRYGAADGQISKLKEGSLSAVVTSPPFTQGYSSGGGINVKGYGPDGADKVGTRTYQGTGGERDPQNIEVLPAGQLSAVITSPPYADSVNSEKHGIDFTKAKKDYPGRVMHEQRVAHADKRHSEQSYGRTEGQIGALKSEPLDAVVTNETYWQAMAQVYAACFRAIKPGGVICVVVKDFVKNKQRVPLCDDTARLLEHCGFTVIERIHAMLVKETTHNDLFSGTTKTKTERKSFFRRLAEKKGSPEINWEEVVIARKP